VKKRKKQAKERMEKKALENEKSVGGKDKSKQKSGNATDTKQEVKSKEPVQIKPESPVANNLPIDKEKQKEKKRLQKQFDDIELKVSSLKSSIKDAETALGDPAIYSDHGKFVEAEKRYNQLTKELQHAEKVYEELFDKLMQLGD
jgi:ATP-binding cassette subfamily F protein 3